MENTFHTGDYILTSRVTYKFRRFERGDVIVFKSPKNPDIEYICDINNNVLKKVTGDATKFVNAEATLLAYNAFPNIYSHGTVSVYSTKKCLGMKPVVLIHETLHLFGLQHTPNTYEYIADIMHPQNTNCYANISQEEINFLKSIYGK